MLAALTNRIKTSLLLLVVLSASVWALPEDAQQPIEISADSAIKDDKQGITIYQGNVKMIQGSLKIQAEKITIYSSEGQVDKIIALGKPAHFQQQPQPEQDNVIAKADTIEYRVTKKMITLTDNALLEQEGSSITGNNIAYDINAGRIEARGDTQTTNNNGNGGRVNVVIPPRTQQ